MNGIAGIFNLDGAPVDRTILERMTAAIAHRGPDGIRHAIDGSIGLGHFMLHTTPESFSERQPLVDETGRYCLTMDGRIDNRDELRADLLRAGQILRDDTDGELVLKAYMAWSGNSPRRLLGDFAYTIWDQRTRSLFCARDPLGVRSFYYLYSPPLFLWASELAAVLAHPAAPRRPNEGVMFEYLAANLVSRDETLYAGILRLPAAHTMTVSPEGVKLRRYWDVNPARTIRYRCDDDYAGHFRELFDRAVSCRLRCHAPAGVQLSGGLDSSSITATAAAVTGATASDRLRLVSRVYPGESFDETGYIHDVARVVDLPVAEIRDPEPLPYDARSARSLDFPGTPNGATCEPMYEAARRLGCRVILTGLGGDEYFSGHDEDSADLLVRLRWLALFRNLQDYDRGARLAAFLRYACLPLLPPRFAAGLRRILRRPGSRLVPAWIGGRLAGPEIAARLRTRRTPRLGYAARRMYRDAFDGWHAQAFESNGDLAAEYGLELRHPFHDRRVIEFAFAIPASQRRRNGLTKFVLRQAMRGRLPDSVLGRTDKAEFSLLFVRALERLGGSEAFVDSGIARAGWVVPAELARKYAVVRSACDAGSDCFDGHLWPLWMVRALEIWHHNAFLETGGRVREPPHSTVASRTLRGH